MADHDIDLILTTRNCMTATLQIIKMNFPELLSLNLHNNYLFWLDGLSNNMQIVPALKILNLSKNKLNFTWELWKVKDPKFKEQWLEENQPLVLHLPRPIHCVSANRKYVPMLLPLDGQDLPPPRITMDVGRHYLIKSYKNAKDPMLWRLKPCNSYSNIT